jgi:hypothetical protein
MTPEPYHVVCSAEDVSTTVNVPCLELAVEFCEFLTRLGWVGQINHGHYHGAQTPLAEDCARLLTRAFAARATVC